MPRMAEEQFLALIDQLRETLTDRDSMEGTISWCWTDEPGVYNVTGMYRVGNSEGQGGCILLRGEPEPALCGECGCTKTEAFCENIHCPAYMHTVPPQPMEPIPGALT